MTTQQDLSRAIADFLGLSPTTKFITVPCAECQQPIVLPIEIYNKRQQDGRNFHCYQGHSNVFREPENNQLKKEIATLKERIQQLEQRLRERNEEEARCYELWGADIAELKKLKRQAGSYKSQITKLKKKLQTS